MPYRWAIKEAAHWKDVANLERKMPLESFIREDGFRHHPRPAGITWNH